MSPLQGWQFQSTPRKPFQHHAAPTNTPPTHPPFLPSQPPLFLPTSVGAENACSLAKSYPKRDERSSKLFLFFCVTFLIFLGKVLIELLYKKNNKRIGIGIHLKAQCIARFSIMQTWNKKHLVFFFLNRGSSISFLTTQTRSSFFFFSAREIVLLSTCLRWQEKSNENIVLHIDNDILYLPIPT